MTTPKNNSILFGFLSIPLLFFGSLAFAIIEIIKNKEDLGNIKIKLPDEMILGVPQIDKDVTSKPKYDDFWDNDNLSDY